MRGPHILQIVDLVDPDLEIPGLHDAEEITGIMLEFVACDDVVHQGGAHDGGVVGGELLDREGWDGAGGGAEVYDLRLGK